MAAMSEVRPSKFAGPTVRHLKPAMVAESSGGRADCANAADAAMALAASAWTIELGLMGGGEGDCGERAAASGRWYARPAIGPEQHISTPRSDEALYRRRMGNGRSRRTRRPGGTHHLAGAGVDDDDAGTSETAG